MDYQHHEQRAELTPLGDQSTDVLFAAVESQLRRRQLPEATYRVQFNAAFTFRDARELAPYWAALGVSHLYASPYLKARAGSTHGYDIVDHTALNPEIGTETEYDKFVRELHKHNMGQILDVVPNHMGVASNDNAWWADVLENGPSSPYASFFDIDWMPLKADLANKVLLPVLGDQFGKVLEDGQLKLHFEEGAVILSYYDRCFPIAPRPSAAILKHRVGELEQRIGTENPNFIEYQSILTAISHLPSRTETDREKINERRREKEVIKRRLNELAKASPEVRAFLDENVRIFNGTPDDPRSFDLLDQLLFDQAYRLAYWRVASDEINYRRFFDVNELAAICMENPEVFQKTHSLILRLVAEGKVDGLRIDHPDGLFDPPGYLRRLQQARFLQMCRDAACAIRQSSNPDMARGSNPEASRSDTGVSGAPTELAATRVPADELAEVLDAERQAELLERWAAESGQHPDPLLCRPLYLVVEKILGRGERLPEQWPVHGTTGYEFLNTLGGLFVDRAAAKTFDAIYARFIRSRTDFRDLAYQCKKQTMLVSMSSEIEVLAHELDRISEQNRWSRDFTLNTLRTAIREVIACFPVYRTYTTEAGVDERDRQYVEQAVARAKRKNPATSASIFDFVRDVLLLHYREASDNAAREAQRRFVGKFQQVTGPVMAKGLEDTAFYIYNRLVSLNEVGGEPDKFGTAVATFHQRNQERQAHWPHALLPATTHDTKRSEDVRARINVLSELPSEWRAHLARWSRINQRRKTTVDGDPAPSRNDEYLLYQTLIGTWPFEPIGHLSQAGEPAAPVQADLLVSPRTGARHRAENLGSGEPTYVARIQQYMLKAAREAKVHTSWISPHEPYERALQSFVAAILGDTRKNGFLASFATFTRGIADYGIWNSLSQTLLRLTSPGVPDIYQATELWDFSLVDPDNRRPVDYRLRREILQSLENRIAAAGSSLVDLARELISSRTDGRIKLFLISQVLNFRRSRSGLFTTGAYLPLEAEGARREHVCAFVRKTSGQTVVALAPRLVVRLTSPAGPPPTGPTDHPPAGPAGQPPTGLGVWSDTFLPLPGDVPGTALRNILTGEVAQTTSQSSGRGVLVSDILRSFPVALLEAVR